MNQMTPALSLDRTEMTRSLAHALEADPAGLAATLLEMLDRVDALLSVKEVASGRYLHVNEAMAALFGRSVATMLVTTDADLMELAQVASIRAAEQSALGHEGPTLSEHRIDRDGRRHEFSVTRMPLPVILISGMRPLAELDRHSRLGVEAILFKPHTSEELVATVRETLRACNAAHKQTATRTGSRR